jgi:cation diffusion facilitator family transporter
MEPVANTRSMPAVNLSHNREKSKVALLSVLSNIALVALKLIIGGAIGSISVLSEAIHSGVDLLAAFIALVAVRAAGQPADRKHPFGHGKFENLSGTIEALLIFLAAGWIIYAAVQKMVHPAPMETLGWGVAVMFLSSIVNIFVARRLFKVAKKTESVALEADAWHHWTDVYTSAGVMAGLVIISVGEWLVPGTHFHWIDPVAAIFVALLIIKAAYDLTMKSALDLLDVSLPVEEESLIRRHIADLSPLVRGFHKLRTRKSGRDRLVEFHMLVDAQMTVEKSHRITDDLTDAVREHFPETILTIHIEPCKGECDSGCSSDCLLPADERTKIRDRYAKP